jgi:hypothetical protein
MLLSYGHCVDIGMHYFDVSSSLLEDMMMCNLIILVVEPLRMIVANHKYMLLALNLKEKCAPKFDMHVAEREREREILMWRKIIGMFRTSG